MKASNLSLPETAEMHSTATRQRSKNRPNGIRTAESALRIDPAAIRSGVYWTYIQTGGVSAAAAAAFRIEARPQETPHEGLSMFACESPRALLRALPSGYGWCPARFDYSDHKIVRVKVTRHGLNLRFFKTYQAACEAHSRAV